MSTTTQDLDDTLFQDPHLDEKVSRLANDAACQVVYITKERVEGEEEARAYRLHLPPTPPHNANIISTLALIKSFPTLDSLTPLGNQLHIVQLSSQEDAYDGLHSLVHWGVAPWFDAFVSSKPQGLPKKGEAQMGIPVTKKRFAELELSLLHLKQNVEIPEARLSVHPAIRKAVATCVAAGERVSVDAVDSALLGDQAFLNKLQSDVNSWVKEVQAVTKLSRDVSSGTASQEINFWLSMEHALEAIEAQLRGDEVTLALDVLKHAKRFHATVSFIADTGLKEAADLVHKHNILMKDFPLDELLAATDLSKVQEAVDSIFAHVNKKLKLS